MLDHQSKEFSFIDLSACSQSTSVSPKYMKKLKCVATNYLHYSTVSPIANFFDVRLVSHIHSTEKNFTTCNATGDRLQHDGKMDINVIQCFSPANGTFKSMLLIVVSLKKGKKFIVFFT